MEDVKVLKYTIRGLNFRYNALKKINSIIGISKDEKDFLDKVLGTIIDFMEVEAGAVFIFDDIAENSVVRIASFRAEIPFNKEEEVKNKVEGIRISPEDPEIAEIIEGKKDFYVKENPDKTTRSRRITVCSMGMGWKAISSTLRRCAIVRELTLEEKEALKGVTEL